MACFLCNKDIEISTERLELSGFLYECASHLSKDRQKRVLNLFSLVVAFSMKLNDIDVLRESSESLHHCLLFVNKSENGKIFVVMRKTDTCI